MTRRSRISQLEDQMDRIIDRLNELDVVNRKKEGDKRYKIVLQNRTLYIYGTDHSVDAVSGVLKIFREDDIRKINIFLIPLQILVYMEVEDD